MPYDEGGPDPMSLELDKLGDDWWLSITNPIFLGSQNEPGNDWETEITNLVSNNLWLLDSAHLIVWGSCVAALTDYEMPVNTVHAGRVIVAQFTDNAGRAAFGFPQGLDTVDFVQRKATARMRLRFTTASDPMNFDGVYLPVAGFERVGTFDEKDRFPIQVVSYGMNRR